MGVVLMTLALRKPVITLPGVYDLTDVEYHSDPVPGGSLSSTGLRKLLPPSCPEIFRYWADHPVGHKKEFDFGHVAHMRVLGVGPEPHVMSTDSYKTKAAQLERDEAYARGDIPLLPDEFDAVQEMAGKLRQHPRAGELFAEGGVAEQSLFWKDDDTGVMCRARLDYLTDRIVDYKTTPNVSLGHISKTIENFGYHIQARFYLDGAIDRDLVAPDAEFVFVFQAKTPPYPVTVVDLDETALKIAYERVREALEIYRDCKEADIWPSYSNDIETVSLPAWAVRAAQRENW